MDKGLKKYILCGVKSPFNNEKERVDAYNIVFGSDKGSAVLQDILTYAGYFEVTVPDPDKPSIHLLDAHLNGRKYICNRLLGLLSVKVKEMEGGMTTTIQNYDNTNQNEEIIL